MSQADLRRRMRGSDAMFLYFERKEMPLHIGCVAVLDGAFDEEGERSLAARLPEIPRYRQRVVFAPMNVTHPTWEDDPEFNFKNHIRHVRLDPPGTEAQLSDLSGELFTQLMDRNRPLWDITVVDGLEGGRSALVIRVHHCMVDGISGISLINVLFDTTKSPRVAEAESWNPQPLPTGQEALVDGLSGLWADAAERVIGAQLTILRLAQAFIGDNGKLTSKALLATIPELLRPTEKLPFNQRCSGVRGHCWTRTSFAEARAIRSALGGTINDVVLTAVTGAVMKYVNAHREPLRGRFVRMMVPVNLRTEDPHGRAGNEISMIPLSVPIDIADPAERFREVAKRSAAMKTARIADLIQLIGTGIGWTPPALQQSLAAMPFMPQPVPIVNMVCTNVPGPMVPLYANGRELLTYYPHVPCGSDVGIGVAISSYNQSLFYGVTYDVQAAPDGELFRDFVLEAYCELRDSAGVRPIPVRPTTARPAAAAPPASDLRAHRADAMQAEATRVTEMVRTAVTEAPLALQSEVTATQPGTLAVEPSQPVEHEAITQPELAEVTQEREPDTVEVEHPQQRLAEAAAQPEDTVEAPQISVQPVLVEPPQTLKAGGTAQAELALELADATVALAAPAPKLAEAAPELQPAAVPMQVEAPTTRPDPAATEQVAAIQKASPATKTSPSATRPRPAKTPAQTSPAPANAETAPPQRTKPARGKRAKATTASR